jgi:rhodanese-related sulfurtransferase
MLEVEMKRKSLGIIDHLKNFEEDIYRLESKVLELEQRLESMINIERNHLIRVKNHELLSDEFLASGRKYQDISPEKAWKMYNNINFDFILIDVSSKDYVPDGELAEAVRIPWEEFQERFIEIQSKTTPLLIISEDGAKSVLACEFLSSRGFYNCNNISGGYKHWVGFRVNEVKDYSA